MEESYQLNLPAYAVRGGQPGTAFSYTAVEPRNVVLETVKQAENGDGVVLRMYECENARTKTVVRLPEGAQGIPHQPAGGKSGGAAHCRLQGHVHDQAPLKSRRFW